MRNELAVLCCELDRPRRAAQDHTFILTCATGPACLCALLSPCYRGRDPWWGCTHQIIHPSAKCATPLVLSNDNTHCIPAHAHQTRARTGTRTWRTLRRATRTPPSPSTWSSPPRSAAATRRTCRHSCRRASRTRCCCRGTARAPGHAQDADDIRMRIVVLPWKPLPAAAGCRRCAPQGCHAAAAGVKQANICRSKPAPRAAGCFPVLGGPACGRRRGGQRRGRG